MEPAGLKERPGAQKGTVLGWLRMGIAPTRAGHFGTRMSAFWVFAPLTALKPMTGKSNKRQNFVLDGAGYP